MRCNKYTYFATTLAAFNGWAGLVSFMALSCALLGGNAGAAELGEVTVHSFAGQPLVADVGLTALAPDELTGLQVRLASPDVYRGANVNIHSALASLRMVVTRGEGSQRQFVRLTTRQAIDADYLHLFLELSAGDRHSVRAVTVWLAPAPPAPPMMPAAPAAKVAPEAPAARAPVVAAAPRAALEPGRSRIHRKVQEVEPGFEPKYGPKPGGRSGPTPELKPGEKHRSRSESDAEAQAERERAIKVSAALDIENDALRSKISVLEEKVVVLQQGYAAKPVIAMLPVAPAAAPVAAKAGLLSWIAGAAAVLLLMASGGLGFVYRKKITASRHWTLLSKRFKRKANAPIRPADAY